MQAAGLSTDLVRGRHVSAPAAGLSLLFAAGKRPGADEVERLLAADGVSRQRVAIGCRSDDGRLELLAGGLAFELAGLAPGPGEALPPLAHAFGFARAGIAGGCEAITLLPGAHIAGGRAMVPLVRTMIGIAAGLALPLPVSAVCWNPAGCWMEPDYFSRIAVNWLAGGGFPALGLAAVEPDEAGRVVSSGLAFFAGQEVVVEMPAEVPTAEKVKLAVRVIDYVVRHGPLDRLCELQGGAGETILAEPTHDRRLIRVWRAGQGLARAGQLM